MHYDFCDRFTDIVYRPSESSSSAESVSESPNKNAVEEKDAGPEVGGNDGSEAGGDVGSTAGGDVSIEEDLFRIPSVSEAGGDVGPGAGVHVPIDEDISRIASASEAEGDVGSQTEGDVGPEAGDNVPMEGGMFSIPSFSSATVIATPYQASRVTLHLFPRVDILTQTSLVNISDNANVQAPNIEDSQVPDPELNEDVERFDRFDPFNPNGVSLESTAA